MRFVVSRSRFAEGSNVLPKLWENYAPVWRCVTLALPKISMPPETFDPSWIFFRTVASAHHETNSFDVVLGWPNCCGQGCRQRWGQLDLSDRLVQFLQGHLFKGNAFPRHEGTLYYVILIWLFVIGRRRGEYRRDRRNLREEEGEVWAWTVPPRVLAIWWCRQADQTVVRSPHVWRPNQAHSDGADFEAYQTWNSDYVRQVCVSTVHDYMNLTLYCKSYASVNGMHTLENHPDLVDKNYRHQWVNYSKNFVNPETGTRGIWTVSILI